MKKKAQFLSDLGRGIVNDGEYMTSAQTAAQAKAAQIAAANAARAAAAQKAQTAPTTLPAKAPAVVPDVGPTPPQRTTGYPPGSPQWIAAHPTAAKPDPLTNFINNAVSGVQALLKKVGLGSLTPPYKTNEWDGLTPAYKTNQWDGTIDELGRGK